MLRTARACQVPPEFHPLCAAPSTELSSLNIQGSQSRQGSLSFPPPPHQLHLPLGKHWHCCLPTLSNLHTEGDKRPSGQYNESYCPDTFNIISTWCCAERSSVTVPLPGWSRMGLPGSVGVSVTAAGGKEPLPETEIIPFVYILEEPPSTQTNPQLLSRAYPPSLVIELTVSGVGGGLTIVRKLALQLAGPASLQLSSNDEILALMLM